VQQAHKELPVLRGYKAFRGSKVLPELTELRDHKVIPVQQARKEPLALTALPEPRGYKALRVFKVSLELTAQQAFKEILVQLVRKELLVSRDRKAFRVLPELTAQ
jgi:hypothetical protein